MQVLLHTPSHHCLWWVSKAEVDRVQDTSGLIAQIKLIKISLLLARRSYFHRIKKYVINLVTYGHDDAAVTKWLSFNPSLSHKLHDICQSGLRISPSTSAISPTILPTIGYPSPIFPFSTFPHAHMLVTIFHLPFHLSFFIQSSTQNLCL